MRPGTRFVSHHLEQGPGGDFVPPLEAVHRIDSLLGLRGSHHGQFVGRPDGTNVIGEAAEPPADGIRDHRASVTIAPNSLSVATTERPSTRLGKPLNGTCATTAAIRESSAATAMTWPPPRDVPHSHPFRIDSGVAAGIADRGVKVLLLAIDTNQLTRRPLALAETPIIEGQRGEAGFGDGLRHGLNRWRVLRPAEAGAQTTHPPARGPRCGGRLSRHRSRRRSQIVPWFA